MNSELIYKIPQKPPFLFIDDIEKLEDNHCIVKKFLHGDESYFKGHFPEKPIFPGCLLVECMAQSAEVVLIGMNEAYEELCEYFLANIKSVIFYNPVYPGETIWIETNIVRVIGKMIEINSTVRTAEKRVAKGNMYLCVQKIER